MAKRVKVAWLFHLPPGVLVMMVKRGDRYIVPGGSVELQEGDVLLLISEK